jgi:hypothetical protein
LLMAPVLQPMEMMLLAAERKLLVLLMWLRPRVQEPLPAFLDLRYFVRLDWFLAQSAPERLPALRRRHSSSSASLSHR